MAQVDKNALHQWMTGETVTSDELTQNQEVLRVAGNDTDNRVTELAGPGRTTETVKGVSDALNVHKTSGDHDGRYYTQQQIQQNYYDKPTVDSKINSATATKVVQAGTSFPTTGLTNGQEFYRTDLKVLYVYDVASASWIPSNNGETIADGSITPSKLRKVPAPVYGQDLNALFYFKKDLNSTRSLRAFFSRSSAALDPDTLAVYPNDYPRFVGEGVYIEEGTTNLVQNPDFNTITTTTQVFKDTLTSYTGSSIPAPWELKQGSFAFDANGATTNGTSILVTGHPEWQPMMGTDGTTKLPLTVSVTFTLPAIPTYARLYLHRDDHNEYRVEIQPSSFTMYKKVADVNAQLAQVAQTFTGSTTYYVTLSISPDHVLTAKVYQGTDANGTLLQTLTVTDTDLSGNFFIGVGGDTGTIIANASVTAPFPNDWATGGDSRVMWAVTQSAISGKYSISGVGVAKDVAGYVQSSRMTINPSTAYTLSARVSTINVGNSGVKLYLGWNDSSNTFITASTSDPISGTSSTQQVTVASTSPSNGVYSYVSVRIYDFGTVTFDNVQLEQKACPTTFTVGTRSDETLSIPTTYINKDAGTIACRIWLETLADHYQPALSIGTNSGNRFLIMVDPLDSHKIKVWDGFNDTEVVISSTVTAQAKQVYHICYTWGVDGKCLYINSVKEASNPSTDPIYVNDPVMMLGHWGTDILDGWISDLAIWDRALTDAEIQQLCLSGEPIVDALAVQYVRNDDILGLFLR